MRFIFLILAALAALPIHAEEGTASWYGGKHVGRKTASGEIFTRHLLTAAHRTLPLGTLVRVINLRNNRSIVVKINDRGPYVGGRVIDLSERAARDLAMFEDGVAEVRLERISFPGSRLRQAKNAAGIHAVREEGGDQYGGATLLGGLIDDIHGAELQSGGS